LDTNKDILSAFFIAKLFGAISPNNNKSKVTIQVAIQTAID
jgi:hypothetical protein